MGWQDEIKNIENGASIAVEVEIEIDKDGYFDRECPYEECKILFKVCYKDWKEKVKDDEVFCPKCRHEADSTQWKTKEQIEYREKAVIAHLNGIFSNMFQDKIRKSNIYQPPDSAFSSSLSYKPSPKLVNIPPKAAELMQQRYSCEKCECRYAAIGAAFFCPACGHNSAQSCFDDSIKNIEKTLNSISVIKLKISEVYDIDTATNMVRAILENTLSQIVSAFQRFAESTFSDHPEASSIKLKKNVFQRLDDSSDLWVKVIGKRYEDMLNEDEFLMLKCLFQQRHLFCHKEGIVDSEYIQKSGDKSYKDGQRLIIKQDAILQYCKLIKKLKSAINDLAQL